MRRLSRILLIRMWTASGSDQNLHRRIHVHDARHAGRVAGIGPVDAESAGRHVGQAGLVDAPVFGRSAARSARPRRSWSDRTKPGRWRCGMRDHWPRQSGYFASSRARAPATVVSIAATSTIEPIELRISMTVSHHDRATGLKSPSQPCASRERPAPPPSAEFLHIRPQRPWRSAARRRAGPAPRRCALVGNAAAGRHVGAGIVHGIDGDQPAAAPGIPRRTVARRARRPPRRRS